jgi:hypothetical protein
MTGKVMLRTVAAILIVVTIAGPCMAFPLSMLRPLAGPVMAGARIAISGMKRGVPLLKTSGRMVVSGLKCVNVLKVWLDNRNSSGNFNRRTW